MAFLVRCPGCTRPKRFERGLSSFRECANIECMMPFDVLGLPPFAMLSFREVVSCQPVMRRSAHG